MNTLIIPGIFFIAVKDRYRSRNGLHMFDFKFVDRGRYFDIYCTYHPSLNGRSSDPHKTHLYRSGKICFVSGKEPRNLRRARRRAAEWAEYFLEYRRTGRSQS